MTDTALADKLDFLPEEEQETCPPPAAAAEAPWKIIVADDEPEVHSVTRLALAGVSHAERDLELISAYSGREAVEQVVRNPDAALLLLDVVMETDHAGLDVVREIRESLGNHAIRIVLRTGQPGQAPERTVVQAYDINDYREKTELTAQKLFTLVHTAIRGYCDIRAIEAGKTGLETIIEASGRLFELQTPERFAQGVMDQLIALLQQDGGAMTDRASGLVGECNGAGVRIVAGTGRFRDLAGTQARGTLDARTLADLDEAVRRRSCVFGDDRFTGHFTSRSGAESLFHVSVNRRLRELDRTLIELFARNVAISYDNLHLNLEIDETQNEILCLLGDAVETRSQETGSHVRRVAEYSRFIAREYGLSEEAAELLRMASPLHDLGKIAIPDRILNKPGKLTAEEWQIMQRHTTIGFDMLKKSSRPIMQAASVIALDHHEKWNGEGYPNGKRGEEIHIFGRITALADVFDALGTKRAYKQAWPLEEILAHIRAERGRHFDPRVVDAVLDNLTAFLEAGAASTG